MHYNGSAAAAGQNRAWSDVRRAELAQRGTRCWNQNPLLEPEPVALNGQTHIYEGGAQGQCYMCTCMDTADTPRARLVTMDGNLRSWSDGWVVGSELDLELE